MNAPPAAKASANPRQSSQEASTAAKYRAGTLRYTSSSIVLLFIWLLWGDFCLYLMEAVIPNVLPLQLKALGASSSVTTTLLSVVPGIVGILWNPIVSTTSDRYRSRWGRRIPFLLCGTPLIVFFLVALGWADAIGATLHRVAPLVASPAMMMIGVISVLVVGFYACNVVVYNLFFSLFNDVVPRELMGRFAVYFRVVGTSAGAIFNLFIFPHAQTHLKEIYIGAATLYGIAYLLMCMKVKEGEYPDPPVRNANSVKTVGMVSRYFRECFSHSFYIYYFLSGAFWVGAVTMTPFLLLMNLSLGLSMEQVGWINGMAAIISIPAFLITGFLMKRVGALRLYFWMKATQVIALGGLMVFLYMDLPPNYILTVSMSINIILLSVNAILLVAGIPINMMLLPREQYAQFSSAGAMTSGVFGIIFGILGGLFIDGIMGIYSGSEFAYRYAPGWATICAALSMLCFYKVYRFVTTTHGTDLTTFLPPFSTPLTDSKTL